jgi:hypothetical protein
MKPLVSGRNAAPDRGLIWIDWARILDVMANRLLEYVHQVTVRYRTVKGFG